MSSLLPMGKQIYLDNAGAPLVGGKLYTYAAGTSTPKATYADQAATQPNPNPVVLDSRGEALVFWSGSYKAVLKDSLDNLIWSVDNIVEFGAADVITDITGSIILPRGTTLQRDAAPATGYIRYNTDTDQLEMYYAGTWADVQRSLVSGTTIKTVNNATLLGAGNVDIGLDTVIEVVLVTTAGPIAAVAGTHYIITGPAAQITMPTPALGSAVWVTPANGLATNTMDFGTTTITGPGAAVTGILTMEMKAPLQCRGVSATNWVTS